MLNWKEAEEVPQPAAESKIDLGDIKLSVRPAEPAKHWQWFSLTLTEFSDLTLEECEGNWPREALDLARAALDRMEAKMLDAETEEAVDAAAEAGLI